MELSFGVILGAWIATGLTLFILSFLYEDNPLFKLAEHLYVGVSLGYTIVKTYDTVIMTLIVRPILEKGEWSLLIPVGIGMLMLTRYVPKAAWLSRYAFADGKRTTIAGTYQGNVFDSPNDIAIAKDGTIYFTDPDFQKAAAPGGQPVTGVYRVGTDGKVTLVDGSRPNPNGVSLSPAGDVLYVNAGDGLLRAYPIVNGMPGQGRDIVRGLDIPDGMAIDCHGNIYVTEHPAHRVRVFSPQGRELATIRTDANVTNAAFGGTDGRTLFLTGAGAVWQVRLDVTGSPY